MKSLETLEQERVIQWSWWMSDVFPELDLLFHIPNGGKRDSREAAHFKRLGVKAGVSDLFLPVSRGGYHGLFIEMKAANGKLSKSQIAWLENVADQGYLGVCCYGADEAINVLKEYLCENIIRRSE